MYFIRQIDKHLNSWSKKPGKKPLILRGARQVGKSTAVRHLGLQFENLVEVNFETYPQLNALFEPDLNPSRIVETLSVFMGQSIVPGKTLLFFDEIQACPKALAALRFFYEQLPDLHIIAAGSLLEFALGEIPNFGVGRVQFLYLYPFSFPEFLDAMGESRLKEMIEASSPERPMPEPLHQKAMLHLKRFWLIGGMPESISLYASGLQIPQVQAQLSALIQSFRADFAKYKNRIPASRLSGVFDAVVRQSAGKFVWNRVEADGNHTQIKECLELLQQAGLVISVTHSSGNGVPIGAEANPKKQKMLLLDTGLFLSLSGLSLSQFFLDGEAELINKGGLAEVHWGLEYIKSQPPFEPVSLYYWHREAKSANAEVDYLVQVQNGVLPVEVKASGKGSMQSMRQFLHEKNQPMGYRFSFENFGRLPDCEIIPLYAVSNFGKR